ncbi:MAG: hypothetical protein ACK5L7_01550 [Paludibacteraceae bacterium]
MKNNQYTSLDTIDKKLPFTVPKDYFDNFAVQMEQKIAVSKSIRLKKIRQWMVAAAIFTGLIISGGTYYTHYIQTQKPNLAFDDNYESYILTQVDETSMIDYYMSEQ